MFLSSVYESEPINKVLTCRKCNQKYDIPKMLPCAKLICTKCAANIISQSMDDSNDFRCDFCNQLHKLPDTDFPICEDLLTILSLKPKLITHDKDRDTELSHTQNEIEQLIQKIDIYHKNLIQIIQDHHSSLKEQVINDKEIKLKKINQQSDFLIGQITQHEQKSIENYLNQGKKKQATPIDQLKSIYQEIFLDKTLNDSNSSIVKKTLDEFKSILLDELNILEDITKRCIQYIPSEVKDSNILGRLKMKQTLDTIDYKQMKKISFEDYFTNQDGFELNIEEFSFGYFSNNHLVVSYTSMSKLNLLLIDENKILTKGKLVKKIKKFEDEIQVVGTQMVLMYLDSRSVNQLEVYDNKIELCQNSSAVKQRLIGASNMYIFTYSIDNSSTPLNLYNWNLELIDSIGQRNVSNDSFYFPNELTKICYFRSCYYCLLSNTDGIFVYIVNELTGKRLKEIATRSGILIDLDSDSNLRIINEDRSGYITLDYFTLDGEHLKEIELINFPLFEEIYTCSFMTFNRKGKLAFFDRSNYNFYFE